MTARKIIARADAAFARLEFAAELEHVAASLERLTARTGDNRYRHAARILRGRVGGRPAVDDSAALTALERMVSEGKPLRVALGCIARRMAGKPESVKRRLRRKLAETGFSRGGAGA